VSVSESAFHIAVFCRAPVAGQVKTRLIARYGAQGSAAIYRQLVERTLATVEATCRSSNATASLWVAGDAQHPAIGDWARRFGLPVFRQVDVSDLGARMFDCLSRLSRQYAKALLIGTDCPAFTVNHLLTATVQLSGESPWVFTPAEDGGYVLVGSAVASAAPFVDIEWSTPQVMAATRTALAQAGLRWSETSPLWDVDTPEDVERAIAARYISMNPVDIRK
jgi:uncharacterized protein